MKSSKSFSLITVLTILLGYSELAQAFYDPNTGSFLSRDPIEERGGENLYGFVRNDGVGRWDVLGQKPGDEHETLDKAVASAAKYIAELTADSRLRGLRQEAFRPPGQNIAPPYHNYIISGHSGPDYKSVKFHYRNLVPNSQSITVYGLEYSIEVYCKIKYPHDNTYVEANLIQGSLPTLEDLIKGTYGQTAYPVASNPPQDGGIYSLSAHLHTHNMGIKNEVHDFLNPTSVYQISKTLPSTEDQKSREMKPSVLHYVVYEGGELHSY